MGLKDEVGLAGNPDAVGDEMVRKNGWIQLVVGLVGLSLVDLGQRSLASRVRKLWSFRVSDLGLGSIRQHRFGRQPRQAKQHGKERQPKAHQNPGWELKPS